MFFGERVTNIMKILQKIKRTNLMKNRGQKFQYFVLALPQIAQIIFPKSPIFPI